MCTLLLQCDQSGAGAEAVPSGAVVAQLEILCQSLWQHQGGQDAMVADHCLHWVTAGGTRRQAHVSKGPHLSREAGEKTAGSKSHFYEELSPLGEAEAGPAVYS